MTPTKDNTAYIIMRADGKYLKGSSSWEKVWVSEIGQARFYSKKHHANNSMKHVPIYSKEDPSSARVVAVGVFINDTH
jgi:hypothetical protein